ncbi:hypothetical protein FRC10_009213 [Ceratobasidium sp. 414]|nr:hypothetical protein FRC10_009213 [Ceratobasidium sp. 414]
MFIEIKLEPATSTYPITAKVLVDDKMAHRLPKIARGQPLLWHDVPPWQVPHIGSVEYIISAVGDQHETTLACDTGKFTIKLEFATPEPDEDVATKMLDKAQKADRQQRLLEKLGPTRNAIKTILDLGTAVAELHPAAKMALGICNQAWAKLEAQEQCDASVESLIDGLASIMPYVEAVKVAAKLPQLQRTVASLIHLIEDASRFIIEYKFDGGAAQEQVDNLVKKFGALAGEFDRGVNVQTYQTVDMSGEPTS